MYPTSSAKTVTTLGGLPLGSAVHLERALAVGARLGGHFVAGHVDGIAVLEKREHLGDALRLTFSTGARHARFLVEKGPVALAGVSLTVNEVEGERFSIVLIPHSQRGTTLADARPGDRLNLETDLLARYVARLLETAAGKGHAARPEDQDVSLLSKLRGSGYL